MITPLPAIVGAIDAIGLLNKNAEAAAAFRSPEMAKAAFAASIEKIVDLDVDSAAASAGQGAGADQVGKALIQLDRAIRQNVSAGEKLASVAEELSALSGQLSAGVA